MTPRAGRTLGLEMEMAVARRDTGASHPVGGYFEALAAIKAARGEAPDLTRIGERIVGVSVAAGESTWTTASTCSRPRSRRCPKTTADWPSWRGAPR